jgi:raffinose/stachyose/melibiose transport system permease protein
VVFPLLRPITGTVLILNAVFIWNDFFTPLLYLGGSEKETIPVRIFSFVGQYVSDYGLVFAGLVLAALPILAIFLVLQKYVIKGFSSGLKG